MENPPATDPTAIGRAAIPPALHQAAFLFLGLLCLTPRVSPPVALALGMFFALTIGDPFPSRSKPLAKWLLQASVVALGFSMDLAAVLRAGVQGFVFAAASIAATLALGALLGRRLGVERTTGTLVSAGTAICGGSAIAAVGSVVAAGQEEMSVALGAVFLLNAVALLAFPPLGHLLHLSQTQFGTWAGVAIHDLSSVVGAASRYGLTALQTATAVKLSRALWIVPVTLAYAQASRADRRRSDGVPADGNTTPGTPPPPARVQAPWFIGLFLLASALRTAVPAVALTAAPITHLATAGLTLTLFLIGAGISRATLRTVGWRPLVLGLLLWVTMSIGSLAVIRATVP